MIRTVLYAATVVIGVGLCSVSAARGEERPCFTAESISGSWAVVATYGANVAVALGDRTIAENGDFTGTFLLNAPTAGSPTGARTITTGSQLGTYAVNCDGTGTVTRTLTSSTGVVTT